MSRGAAFVQGFLPGVQAGQSIANHYDEEADEDREEALALETYHQNKKRNDLLFSQSQGDRKLAMQDRIRQLARQENLDAQASKQLEIENARAERNLQLSELSSASQRRVHNAQADNNISQQQVAELEMSQLKQADVARKAVGMSQQANALLEQGNYQQGLDLYRQISNEHDLGLADIIDGKYSTMEAEEAIQGLLSGEKGSDDPDAQRLIKTLLTPSLKASGRDMSMLEPAGLRESRPGFYAIAMKNKKTGEIVPATDLKGTNQAGDPITEVSREELIEGATSWLGEARKAELARDALKAQKQMAAMQSRFMTEKDGVDSEDEEGKLPADQQAFVDLQSTESEQTLAKLFIAENGYDSRKVQQMVQRTKAIAAKNKGMSLSDAKIEMEEEIEIDAYVAKTTTSLIDKGIDSDKAEKLARRLVAQSITREQFQREAKKLIDAKNAPDSANTGAMWSRGNP